MLPPPLDQPRRLQVLLPGSRQRRPSFELHLGLSQFPLVGLQPLPQLSLGKDPPILPQHPQLVQLRGHRQPPTLAGQGLGELPRLLPDELQLPRREGHHAPQFPLQLLGRQNLHPPRPVQTPGLDHRPVRSLDGRPLDLSRCQGRPSAPQLHLQAVLLGSGQHRVRRLLPTASRLRETLDVPPVVPGPPGAVFPLRRGKGHRVRVEVNLASPVLRMEVGQGERSGRTPLLHPSPDPHPHRLPLHLGQVGGHHLPQDVPRHLGMILQRLAHLGRQGDQRLLRLAEQSPALGQLRPLQVIAHGQFPEQGRRG